MKYKKSDKIEDVITKMLKEDTGMDMLDSGGAYGRSWQMNGCVDFKNTPEVELEVWENEFSFNLNVYHYLVSYLLITRQSVKLNNELQRYMKKSEDYHLGDMEHFVEKHNEGDNYLCNDNLITNTYNGEEFISQTLQYGIFQENETYFIVLQIHGGCDVRGGYTEPTVFELDDAEYFLMAQRNFTMSDGEHYFETDDGYHWRDADGEQDEVELNDFLEYDEKNNKLFNKKTKKEFVVSGFLNH